MQRKENHGSSPPGIRIIKPATQGLKNADGRQRPRLGVLGGSFNPITNAHIILGEKALQTFSLAEVIFMLPETLPHKQDLEVSLSDRIALMNLALQEHARFSVAVSRHGLFMDIYKDLSELFGSETQVFFLTGRDAAERILTWKYPDPEKALSEMFSAFELIVADRQGKFEIEGIPMFARYKDKIHGLELPSKIEQLSSTAIRKRIKRSQSIKGLVPDGVGEFIRARKLYL